jgi:hypothetical protein
VSNEVCIEGRFNGEFAVLAPDPVQVAAADALADFGKVPGVKQCRIQVDDQRGDGWIIQAYPNYLTTLLRQLTARLEREGLTPKLRLSDRPSVIDPAREVSETTWLDQVQKSS